MRFYFTIKLSSKSETQSRHNKAQNTTKSGSVPFALWKTYCISTFTLAFLPQIVACQWKGAAYDDGHKVEGLSNHAPQVL